MSLDDILPPYVTPLDIAQHFGVGERWVKEKAREIDAFAMFGGRMVLLSHHVELFMEACQCPSNSTSAAKSGTTVAPLPGGNSETLRERVTRKSRNGSKRTLKQKRGSVVSMDRGRA